MFFTREKPKVRIIVCRGYGDCECCGGYDYCDATLEAGGRKVAAGYDGHLGGGCWDGDVAKLHYWALQMLGFDVQVENAPFLEPPFMEYRSPEYQIVDLLPPQHQRLDVRIEVKEDDHGYEAPLSAAWQRPDGSTRVVLAQGPEWDGSVRALYPLLLAERATVKFRQRRDPHSE